MKFKESLRGYDKAEVDAYVVEMTQKYEDVLTEQKNRIFNLTEENYKSQEDLKRFREEENAISRALVESQKAASVFRDDAEKFSAYTLKRAKIFLAAWQAYAKLIVDNFSSSQIKDFNALSQKIEKLIDSYQTEAAATVAKPVSAKPEQKPLYANPIDKVEQAAGVKPAVDLRELQKTDATLEELCKQLGLKD